VKASTSSWAHRHPSAMRGDAPGTSHDAPSGVEERIAQTGRSGSSQFPDQTELLHPDEDVTTMSTRSSQAALIEASAEGSLSRPVSLESRMAHSAPPRPR
jgi:hypothetical protein